MEAVEMPITERTHRQTIRQKETHASILVIHFDTQPPKFVGKSKTLAMLHALNEPF
jgi:hypothetical protein